jgi:hypothetical protein
MRLTNYLSRNNSLFNKFVFKLGFFWHKWARLKGFKGPRVPKRAQFTHERVENAFFVCTSSTGENSQILTVSNKKVGFLLILSVNSSL